MCLLSIAAARNFSPWLHLQVYCPWAKPVWKNVPKWSYIGTRTTCRVLAYPWGDVSMLLVSPCMNLILPTPMSHTSLQLKFFLYSLSHLIQWPCCTWEIAFAHLAASSWLQLPLSAAAALLQVGRAVLTPRQNCKTYTSSNWGYALHCYTSRIWQDHL